MSIERVPLVITTGTNASGTAFSPYPIEGRVVEIVAPNPGANNLFSTGATATFTLTRTAGAGGGSGTTSDGGTVVAYTGLTGPWVRVPRQLVQSTTGATAIGYDLTSGVPTADYLTAIVTQGGTSVSGTVFVYYERDRTP